MRVCIVVEGSYPYVQGGVSSWVSALMTKLPEYEFVVQTIAATRADAGNFKYKPPQNLTGISEGFLQDADIIRKRGSNKTLSKKEREALRTLLFAENEDWDTLFDMFNSGNISINAMLMGMDFYDAVEEFYYSAYDRVVFTDFLWTCRSMFLPLFTLMKNKPIEADVYHSMSTGYSGILAAYAGYIYDKPVLLTEHGIYTREREEEIIRSAWTRGIYKDLWIKHFHMLSRCMYARAARVFSLFDKARELQVEYGCPSGKTEVIHNGVAFDAFQNLAGKDPGDTFINVGAVVRVTPIKDVKTMINAFHFAKEKVSALKLFILGNTEEDPQYYKECVELLEALGTPDVVFTGHVNVREYIGKMDISLLTSISEGQPLSVLEAMAARIPCITTNVGDCFDMLNAGDADGRAGICVPVMNVGKLAAAIVELAVNAALRRKMGENGRNIVDKYYRDTGFIGRYRQIYAETYTTAQSGKPHARQKGALWRE